MSSTSFKMGSKNVSTIDDVGYRDGERALAGLGLGGLYGQESWLAALEAITHGVVDDDGSRSHGEAEPEDDRPKRVLVRAQLAAGWRLGARLALFAGPSHALEVVRYTNEGNAPGEKDRRTVKRWTGGHGGLKLEL